MCSIILSHSKEVKGKRTDINQQKRGKTIAHGYLTELGFIGTGFDATNNKAMCLFSYRLFDIQN